MRDALGDRASAVGLRRPDTALGFAVAQLHQIAVGQPQARDGSLLGAVHDGLRARAVAVIVCEFLQRAQRRGKIVVTTFSRSHDHLVRDVQARFAEAEVQHLDHDFVHAALAGLARATEADRGMCQRLNLERDVFEHMTEPGAVLHALEKAAAIADRATVLDHRRQPTHQLLVEAGQGVGRKIFVFSQVDPSFEYRVVCPNAGTNEAFQCANLHDDLKPTD